MNISIIVITFLSLCLCATSYFMFKFALILLKVEDALEEGIGILDERQDSVSKILERPLFLDSPEIRTVHKDLEVSRDAILKIALILSSDVSSNEAGETRIEEKKEN